MLMLDPLLVCSGDLPEFATLAMVEVVMSWHQMLLLHFMALLSTLPTAQLFTMRMRRLLLKLCKRNSLMWPSSSLAIPRRRKVNSLVILKTPRHCFHSFRDRTTQRWRANTKSTCTKIITTHQTSCELSRAMERSPLVVTASLFD